MASKFWRVGLAAAALKRVGHNFFSWGERGGQSEFAKPQRARETVSFVDANLKIFTIYLRFTRKGNVLRLSSQSC